MATPSTTSDECIELKNIKYKKSDLLVKHKVIKSYWMQLEIIPQLYIIQLGLVKWD